MELKDTVKGMMSDDYKELSLIHISEPTRH